MACCPEAWRRPAWSAPDMAETLEARLQKAFNAESRRLLRRRTEVACILTLLIAPIYAVSDYWFYRQHLGVLITTRLVCVTLTAAIYGTLRWHSVGRTRPEGLATLLGTAVAFMMAGVFVLLEGYDTPYFAVFVLLTLTLVMGIPWRLREAILLCGAIVMTYLVAALVQGDILNVGRFVIHVSFLLTASAVALVGLRAGSVLRVREFRTRHAMEQALAAKGDLAAAFEQQSARLAVANQEMEDLLYVASHDLRAPLINVQGFTREIQIGLDELRQQRPASPEGRATLAEMEESIQFVMASVARMDSLIGSLLNVSRIATRTNPTDAVPLGPMVDKIIDSFRYQLDQKAITIALGHLPVVVGDPGRLSQAISNLVDNAIKYMDDRPLRRIEIGSRSEPGTCICYVRDTGPGIPAAKHDAVFRLFHRLANGSVSGEGIGLTLVRKIIEKHGGRVWLEAAPEHGTTFWFTLRPAAPQPGQVMTDVAAS
jgi:signal transduction histidine kinase